MSPLFSGNGRHRRPRQAPNFVVAAGVAGAGLALPLLGATSASAADNATWDAVAECESGGLWSANDDNGYYGGLQLDQESWERHGGTDYAARPDLASRDQQITVAERILDAEGAELFGECAESEGLSEDSAGSPDVDPDGSEDVVDGPVAERPYPTDPSADAPGGGDGAEDGYPGGSPDYGSGSGESGDPAETPEYPDYPASPDSSDSPDSSPSAPDSPGEQSPDPSRPDGSAGSDGDGASGGGAGDAGQDGSGGGKDGGKDGGEHRVAAGESLYSIADEEAVPGGWRELYEQNRRLIGSDPDLILPGQELRL